jgi:protein NrfD
MPDSAVAAARSSSPEPVHGGRYTGPTYHDRPAIKPSPYGWLVWSYIYVAGLSGGAQLIATIANLTARPRLRSVVRSGRYLAVGGSAIGAILLIADLHTPQRWYNMMRIFRRTSPMSIGSYVLTLFGISSAIAAAAQLFGRRPPAWLQRVESIAQIPAALTGAGMGSYTGALLAATSTPMWAAAPRLLAARFASAAVAASAAALSLAEQWWGDRRNCAALDRLACIATVADTAFTAAANREYRARGVASALQETGIESARYKLAAGTAHVLPLVCYGLSEIMPQHSRKLSIAAALGVLAGGLLMRSSIMNAGNSSAERPRDYFSFTQPDDPEPGRPLPHRKTRMRSDHGRANA